MGIGVTQVANSGISISFDFRGRELLRTGKDELGFYILPLDLARRATFYRRAGTSCRCSACCCWPAVPSRQCRLLKSLYDYQRRTGVGRAADQVGQAGDNILHKPGSGPFAGILAASRGGYFLFLEQTLDLDGAFTLFVEIVIGQVLYT